MARGRPKGIKKSGGRQRGTVNRVTAEVQKAATELVDSPKYRAKLKRDLESRVVGPAIEQMLWYFAKGKPKETIVHEGNLTALTDAELAARAKAILERL